MANSRQSTRSRVVASTSPPPTLVAPVADPARGARRARPNASSAVAGVLFPSSIDAHFALVRARLRPLYALERWMKIIPIHSSRRPRSSTPPSPSAPSLARRSPRDFETPTATRARCLPPRRRTPQVTARVFARPVRLRRRCGRLKHHRSSRSADDSLRASRLPRLPRLPRLARARARGDETIAEPWSGLSRDDGLAPPPRALTTVDDGEREREREISRFVPRAPRSLARSPRSRAPASRLALPPPGRMAVLSGHRRGHIDESQTVTRASSIAPSKSPNSRRDGPTDRCVRFF